MRYRCFEVLPGVGWVRVDGFWGFYFGQGRLEDLLEIGRYRIMYRKMLKRKWMS